MCILNDVITHYASVPDTENESHFFIEQYEIQIISAIRRVLTLSAVYDPVVLSVNIVYVLVTSGVITDTVSLGKLMQMVKPLDENVDNSKTMLRIEQVKVQVMARLFVLCFMPDSNLKSSIRSEIIAIVRQNADYWRAKWCVRIRRALLDHKAPEEYALYLLGAAALVSEEQVKKEITPNFELQQLVLILGGIMTALNSLLTQKKTDSLMMFCLIALRFCEPFVQFIKGDNVMNDFVEYVLHILDVLLQLPLMQESSKMRDEIYNESVELFVGIAPFVSASKEEKEVKRTVEPKNSTRKLVIREAKQTEKEEYEYVSEYSYESYYSYETDEEEEPKKEEGEKESVKEIKEVENEKMDNKDRLNGDEEHIEISSRHSEESENQESVEKEEELPKEDKKVVNDIQSTALARNEVKLETDDHLWDSDDEEPIKISSRRNRRTPKEEDKEESVKKEDIKRESPVEEKKEESPKEEEKKVMDNLRSTALARNEVKLETDDHLWDSDDEEPIKISSRRNRRTPKEVKQEELVKEKVIEPKEEDKEESVKKEDIKRESPVEEKKEESPKEEEKKVMDNLRSTALARNEVKLETDDHLWDSDDEEPIKPKRTRRQARRPLEHVEIVSPLGAAPENSNEEAESSQQTRRRSGRSSGSSKLKTFEASWSDGSEDEWADEANASDDWGFEGESDKEKEKPKEPSSESSERNEAKEVKSQDIEESKEEPEGKTKEAEEEEPKDQLIEKPMEQSEQNPSTETVESPDLTSTKESNESAEKAESQQTTEESSANSKDPTDKPIPSYSSSFTEDPLHGHPVSILSTPSVSPSTRTFWELLRVTDLLLTVAPSYLPACRAIRSCMSLFADRSDVRSFFVGRIFDILSARSLAAAESGCLIDLVAELTASDLALRKSVCDATSEAIAALVQRDEMLSVTRQLLHLLQGIYLVQSEAWMMQYFATVFNTFGNAAGATLKRAEFVIDAFIEIATKLQIEHVRFLVAACAVDVIVLVAPRIHEFGKEAISSLVQLAALLYGKTDNKDGIVDIVIRLCAMALDRSVALQPMNVSKAKEDAALTKVNSMVGEILFIVATMNGEKMKTTIQQLPAESALNLQNQLRKTVQVKQSESNAARRRNANRLPVKLDASKFTE